MKKLIKNSTVVEDCSSFLNKSMHVGGVAFMLILYKLLFDNMTGNVSIQNILLGVMLNSDKQQYNNVNKLE